MVRVADISIHAPRKGGDVSAWHLYIPAGYFNPRPPARGATVLATVPTQLMAISIHAPRKGGDPDAVDQTMMCLISIHAPREGGDAGEPPGV